MTNPKGSIAPKILINVGTIFASIERMEEADESNGESLSSFKDNGVEEEET